MTASRATGVLFLVAVTSLPWSFRAYASPPQSFPASASSPGGAPSPAPPALDLHDADAVLRVAVPRTLKSRRDAMAYTYGIDYRNRNFSARGKLLADYTAKYEVIFVEGLPYRRQTEENQKPLSGQTAAEEASRYKQAFAERSHMSVDQKRDYLRRPWNVDVPLPQLTSLFVNRIVGEESIDGRPAIVIDSRPRPGVHPVGEEETRALHKQVKLWVDREDLVVSRVEATLIADDASMKKGTMARVDFFRRDGEWLPAHSDVQFQTLAGSQLIRGETIESNGGFQRFHVDVRLLDPAETAAGGSPSLPGAAH